MTSAAILGLGVIGRSQQRAFSAAGYRLVTYDPADDDRYPATAINRTDFAIICVGTPEGIDGGADLWPLWTALARLPEQFPVLIRSTMPPGTMAKIAAIHPGLTAHAPEFMHERPGGAWPETTDVPFMILGGSPEARAFFSPKLSGMWPKIHECPALTAELVKYVVNLHLATRVTFINEMDKICRAVDADWESVRQAWLMDPRITPEYTGGIEQHGPGFGGRCWPKDLSALIAASESAGYDPKFLKDVRSANARFRA